MNKTVALHRREVICLIILGAGKVLDYSVDDWWNYVRRNWPDGFSQAPGRNTVKSVLLELAEKGKVAHCGIRRGWFSQFRFKVVQ